MGGTDGIAPPEDAAARWRDEGFRAAAPAFRETGPMWLTAGRLESGRIRIIVMTSLSGNPLRTPKVT